jgi:hypothetical protein
MTANEPAYTGQHRRQQAKKPQDSHAAAGGRAIRALAPLPGLDWRADLFASAIVDDYELDDELARDDRSYVPVHELPDSDGDRGTVVWLYLPAHPSVLAGVAP